MSSGEPWWAGRPELLPEDPDLEPLHQRDYVVRAWKRSDTTALIRGAVMDLRPGRFYTETIRGSGGVPDGRPLTMHHMIVDLVVSYPSLIIDDAEVVFEAHPQPGCPLIAPRYRELVGLSIARGFTHEVRRRFGGPRGCTHTTALLQAMGPVAVQCVFAMRRADPEPSSPWSDVPAAGNASGPGADVGFMRDTCHIWSEEGDLWQGVTLGRPPPVPLPVQRMMRDAGVD